MTKISTYDVSFVRGFPVIIFVVRVDEAKVRTAGKAFCPQEFFGVDVCIICQF